MKEKIEEYKEFLKLMNINSWSIYKWVYAKEIDYSYDPKYYMEIKNEL
jgi:hypothetical protein